MRIALGREIRELDRLAIEEYGISGVVLMENAGRAVAREALAMLESNDGYVVFLAGKGNNGGDAYVAARHLFNQGVSVKVLVLAEGISGDARVNLDTLLKMGVPVSFMQGIEEIREEINRANLVVDGLLGTGVKGAVEGFLAEVVKLVNESHRAVLAIDIPSGVQADSGKVAGVAIRALRTVSFALPKLGLYLYPGADYAGKIVIEDISIPAKAIEELCERGELKHHLLSGGSVKLANRDRDSHKGTYGHLLVLGGSRGLTGAVILAVRAAIRSGVGLVTAAVPRSEQEIVASHLVEGMTCSFEDYNRIRFNALALGPGMGKGVSDFVFQIVEGVSCPLVIDADGLNALGEDFIRVKGKEAILTPHPGELARLMGVLVKEIQEDRVYYARRAAEMSGAIVVLKGSPSLVAFPEGDIWVNTTGNPGLATGGSGDVLTGIIGGLLAQGLSIRDAALLGVYIHGLAGDLGSVELGEISLKAGDIVEYLPWAWQSRNF